MESLDWLLDQKTKVTKLEVHGQVFYLREPTVADRDKLDATISSMDMNSLEIRTPLLQAVISDKDGNAIASDRSFDSVPAELVEPLIDKAKDLFGITDPPAEGGSG